MRVQVNSDRTVAVDARLTQYVQAEVLDGLGRFAAKLTRAEVHLSDVNSKRRGEADKRCLLEVRPAGAPPVAVRMQAATMSEAIVGAVNRMQRRLDTFFGRRGREAQSLGPRGSKKASTRAKYRKEPVGEEAGEPSPYGTKRKKKKRIYQARRKPWPTRI